MKKTQPARVCISLNSAVLLAAFLGCLFPWEAGAVGHWVPVTNTTPSGIELMLLLSDGTVMAQSTGGNAWYRLTPNANGSYAGGSWTTRASMHDTRTFYSSTVLRDGRVLVAGGEYGTGGAKAEVYDPVADTWTPTPSAVVGFSDSQSRILPDGRVLVAPVSWLPYPQFVTVIYDPIANSWTEGPVSSAYQDEASWVKLPDDSILTIDDSATTTERYIPSSNTWIADASVPVPIYGGAGEIGAGFLLTNSKAFFLGGSGHTVIYTPSGNTSPGTWTQGRDIPYGLVAQDAPAAMMVNGKILCAVTSPTNHNPVFFFEYDPTANSFTETGSPTGGSSDNTTISDHTYMLDLPDGTVLYSDTRNQVFVYIPDSGPIAAGKPTINALSWNTDGSLHLKGTLFNGISEGASYGDDAQMDSNYPLVRIADGSGNVYYARTFNWSSTGVMTGTRVVTTEFTTPLSLFQGVYSLVVVANGIASDPITFHGPVWVDFNWSGILYGTYNYPYNTLTQGVSAVVTGGTIAIKPGASHETMTISKPMTITAVGGSATIGH